MIRDGDEQRVIARAAEINAIGEWPQHGAFRGIILYRDRPTWSCAFVAGVERGDALARFRVIDSRARTAVRETVLLSRIG